MQADYERHLIDLKRKPDWRAMLECAQYHHAACTARLRLHSMQVSESDRGWHHARPEDC